MKMRILYRLLRWGILAAAISLIFVLVADYMVRSKARGHLYTDVQQIPHNKVGLLLGTSKILPNGLQNLYFKYRIDAAVALYQAGKIDFILASGDNRKVGYDEPTAMQQDLIARGIPSERIYLDYAGFRTFDSVVRSKKVFGQDGITVISQAFHNERALYLAKANGMTAQGFNAQDVTLNAGLKTQVREKFARVKMLLDLWFGATPKFLGEKIEIK